MSLNPNSTSHKINQEILTKTLQRFDQLATISESKNFLLRTLLSDKMFEASKLLINWMENAKLDVNIDPIGNISATTKFCKTKNPPTLLTGSHYDTVKNSGKYDGPLGIICALSAIDSLNQQNIKLNYEINLLAFSDEEGVRFHTAFLASKYFFNKIDSKILNQKDAKGETIGEAFKKFSAPINKNNILNNKKIIGYIEAHIEQGRILEEDNFPLAVVKSIAGQSRIEVSIKGMSDHAGNTPMNLRKDALCAASKFILFAEKTAKKNKNSLITVGKIQNSPNISNTISDTTFFTIDIRSSSNTLRKKIIELSKEKLNSICSKRKLEHNFKIISNEDATKCDTKLNKTLNKVIKTKYNKSLELVSGAGHDAVVASEICPITMLFTRCKGGISHHPSEFVTNEDIKATIEIMVDFFIKLNEQTK